MARREPIPFLALVAFFGLFLAPVAVLLLVPIGLLPVTFEPYLLTSPSTIRVVETTLYVATLSALIRTPLMFAFGWLVGRTDLPGRRFFDSIGLFGLTIPDLLKALAWLILLNPVDGLMTLVLVHDLHLPPVDIYSPTGLAFVCAWVSFPLEYLAASAAIKNLDPSVEEASRIAGHPAWRTFLHVSFPSLTQAFVIVFSLGFLITFTDFDVAIVLAPLGGYNVLGTELYYAFAGSVTSTTVNYGSAATLGLLFVVASLVLFAFYLYLTRMTFRFQTLRGPVSRASLHPLTGVRKWIAVGFCSFMVLMAFVLPLISLFWLSLTVPGRLFVGNGMTNYFAALFLITYFSQAWVNSIELALLVTLVSVPLGALLAYGIFRSRILGSRVLEYIVILPRAIPGLVYGLGVFLMVLFTPGLKALYGTFVPFVFSVVVSTVPLAILIVGANMVQIGEDVEEASRVSGSGWGRTFVRILLPLNFRALLSSVQYAFISTFTNLGSVVLILLATPTFVLVMPLLLQTMLSNPAGLNMMAAASIMITGFLGLVIVVAKLVESRGRWTVARQPA